MDAITAFHATPGNVQKAGVEAAPIPGAKSATKASTPWRTPVKNSLNLAAMLAVAGGLAVATAPTSAQAYNPCSATAAKANPCSANSRSAKVNPCSAKANPCSAKSNPCSANPCSAKANPCAAKAKSKPHG